MPRAPRQRPAERYRLKYRRLRRAARALVFENGALCDEVARLEAKWLRARDERRFLLGRLLRRRAAGGPGEAAAEGGAQRRARRGGARAGDGPREAARPRAGPKPAAAPAAAARAAEEAGGAPAAILRAAEEAGRAPAALLRAAEDAGGPPAAAARPAPRRRGGAARLPLTLGPLTVHSLGVGGPAAILPPGFRSTRLFASTRRPARRCLYTCRIAAGPRCEIVAEDEPGRVLAGPTPDACHGRLLQALGEAGGRPRAAPAAPGAGDDFFGLSHPAVRRLLRGEAGTFPRPEEEEEEEEEEEDEEEEDEEDDDDEEEDEEEEEEDGAPPAFAYADVFLGSPAGSDE